MDDEVRKIEELIAKRRNEEFEAKREEREALRARREAVEKRITAAAKRCFPQIGNDRSIREMVVERVVWVNHLPIDEAEALAEIADTWGDFKSKVKVTEIRGRSDREAVIWRGWTFRGEVLRARAYDTDPGSNVSSVVVYKLCRYGYVASLFGSALSAVVGLSSPPSSEKIVDEFNEAIINAFLIYAKNTGIRASFDDAVAFAMRCVANNTLTTEEVSE